MAAVQRYSRITAGHRSSGVEKAQAGFTTGTPWLKVNPNYTSINAEAQMTDPILSVPGTSG